MYQNVVHHPTQETEVKSENQYKTPGENNMPAFLDNCVHKTAGADINSAIGVPSKNFNIFLKKKRQESIFFLTFLFLVVIHHPARATGVKCEHL